MFEADVNYLSVIIAAILVQALGFAWYSMSFQQAWMQARGISETDVQGEEPTSATYMVPLLCSIVIAYTFARLADMTGADTIGYCLALAAFVWAGFAGTVQLIQINFSPRADKVPTFLIEGGYQLGSFLIVGLVIGLFQ